MAELEDNAKRTNEALDQTLQKIRAINRNPARPGNTGIEANLEEELKRRKLVTNEPD